MNPASPLRIGIVGGGIAGVGLALGLCRHRHLDVQLFESAPAFGEIGAGVSFGPNAVRALAGLGMGEPYAELADRTPAPWQDVWFEWRRGEDARLLGQTLAPGVGQSSVHRADFLDALATRLPFGLARFGKRAVAVEQDADVARVRFADGSQYEGDVLIAADGIKSAMRGEVLRALGHAPAEPRFTGTCAYRGLIDAARLRAAFAARGVDAHLVDVPQMLLGLDAHILTFPVKQGRLINVVAFVSDRSEPAPQWRAGQAWVREASRREMLEAFAHWGEAARTLLECIDTPTHWALHDLAELPGYVHGRLALIGDAAHAMLPHQGAGAGQGLEDAYLLAQLLATPGLTRGDLPALLQVYERLRLPRACRVQRTSREAGELYELRDPQAGADDTRLAQTLAQRFDWIWAHDLEAEVAQGRRMLAAGVTAGA
ncbi:salicylate 1-monooxygenase [Xanthomonas sacchari]|uniref:Salicylate hydroxylase n=1 Tax=Xanthomonas sacchari TaxID=56458 RepID=A0ABT3E120_9XANT|nr:salicylate 1-monooxygenase [Xanthomonas sacchari]MCW0401454.1 Salicylate hydroxylase [Xanthomonas sacchari]MCW0420280.1 Salicylate hydroxylase [Xanthomonas sacchari]UYK72227.1 salicylate 1-monooxygenase [Xanthomonas sacchari]UYK84394.1 salicylate 1-monooxygenase [Xanthomonas sacchari]